jgi:predicted Zn-dependent protease
VRSRSLRRAVIALGALACLAPGACDTPVMVVDDHGFSLVGGIPFSYHWAPGHEIAIFVDTRGEPAGVDLLAAVNRGIAAWEAVGLLGEVQLTVVTDVHAADVIVHHPDAPSLITIDTEVCDLPIDIGGGRTYACVVETSPNEFTPQILQLNDGSGGHVKMDVRINLGAISDPQFFDAIVAHELGHVLGIGLHSSNASDLMFGTPRVFVPSNDDAAALRYVLSRPAAARF